MGFPVGYSELLVPRLVLNVAYLLGSIRSTVCWLLHLVGLGEFLETETSYWEDQTNPWFDANSSVSAQKIRDLLPVVEFGVLAEGADDGDVMCAVCLNNMERFEEIRRLTNCRHIFHRGCLDKWLDHDQRTCPLCRSPLLPDEIEREINVELRTLDPGSNLFTDASSVLS